MINSFQTMNSLPCVLLVLWTYTTPRFSVMKGLDSPAGLARRLLHLGAPLPVPGKAVHPSALVESVLRAAHVLGPAGPCTHRVVLQRACVRERQYPRRV